LVGVTNWRSTPATRALDLSTKLHLDPTHQYVAFDFWNQALAGTIGVDANRSYPVNRIIWPDCGFDLVVSSSECGGERDSSGQAVGAPDIVEIGASRFFALPEQLGLLP